MSRLDVNALTWTALLARWVEYAQASLALPKDAEGERWRQSVPMIIKLQAVTFALGEIDQLPPAERALARDKADMLIDRCADDLAAIWEDADDGGTGVPARTTYFGLYARSTVPMLAELFDDADAALELAYWSGLTELVWRGDEPLAMPDVDLDDLLDEIDPERWGSFAIAQPGTLIMSGEPFMWWSDMTDDALPRLLREFPGSESASPGGPARPRQLYRKMDAAGRAVRDVIAWYDDESAEGLPLLVPILEHGEPIGSFTLDAAEWEAAQRSAIGDSLIEVIDRTRG